ncbi:MAG: hypothetical protein ACOZNI_13720 [Myxococcota bacterium]
MLLLLASLIGCGPDCQSSCDKIFGDGPDECNIQLPGHEGATGRQEMTSACMSHCEAALARNGEIGDYSPNERSSANDSISLENEKQAAAWMDCVAETECSFLDEGYCAPVKNFP